MMKTKSRSTRRNVGSRGCTMNMPIMPIAICTISSECGWYMKVPLFTQLELVDEGLARLDMRLSEPADAVHAVRQQHAVPMNGGVLRQLVGDEDAELVAFDRFDGRARRLPVVAPEIAPSCHRRTRAPPARRRDGIPSSRRSCARAASSRSGSRRAGSPDPSKEPTAAASSLSA